MRDRELYRTLLGLTDPWDVVDVEVELKERSVVVYVAYRSDAEVLCPECGGKCPRHDTRTRSWRHLDTMQYRTVLTAEVPRSKCDEHGVRQVKVPWAEDKARFTALFECLVIDWLHHASIQAVAEMLDLTWDEVAGIQERAVRRGLARRKLEAPPLLGVDETSFQKRHQYVTVVSDLERGRVLHVADERTKESLKSFFSKLTPEQRSAISAVAMDMFAPYIETTREMLPNGDDLINFDKFHVAKHLSEAVNKVRLEEHRELLKDGDTRLKNTRYLWLRNPEKMTPEQDRSFAPLRKSNLRVARAWAMKETAMGLWGYTQPRSAEKAWKRLLAWMARSRLEPMVKVGRMIRRHFKGVLNAVLTGITNAMAEGLNSRIQWVKRQACGFRNRERFRNAIYFHLGGLELYPELSR
jgi:transposase